MKNMLELPHTIREMFKKKLSQDRDFTNKHAGGSNWPGMTFIFFFLLIFTFPTLVCRFSNMYKCTMYVHIWSLVLTVRLLNFQCRHRFLGIHFYSVLFFSLAGQRSSWNTNDYLIRDIFVIYIEIYMIAPDSSFKADS